MKVQTWLALSNLIALFPLYRCWSRFGLNSTPTIIVLNTILASILMHLSETKHGLIPRAELVSLSQLLLNIDRGMALTATGWFGWYWWEQRRDSTPIILLLIGLVGSAIGERTQNLFLYGLVHGVVWHGCAYIAMGMVVSLFYLILSDFFTHS